MKIILGGRKRGKREEHMREIKSKHWTDLHSTLSATTRNVNYVSTSIKRQNLPQ